MIDAASASRSVACASVASADIGARLSLCLHLFVAAWHRNRETVNEIANRHS
jgi:hypothetical protein